MALYYTADQLVNITSEGSNTVSARIGTVERGVVDGFIIDNVLVLDIKLEII